MERDFRGCVSGQPQFVKLWHEICDEHDRKESDWVTELRAKGIKAAHPNDGWVDRENNRIHFAYPHFNDGAGVGDLVMLGWATDDKSHRLVRLTGEDDSGVFDSFVWWDFEDA